MTLTEYLFAVHDGTGREVVSWRGEAKVADVTAVRAGDIVTIEHAGDVVATAGGPVAPDVELSPLLRWHTTDKLAAPVRRKVVTR